MAISFNTNSISETIQTLFDLSDSVKKVASGNYIFREGDQGVEIYLIKSGIVRLSKHNGDGMELNLRICKTNDLMGELTLFKDDIQYFLSAKAMTPVEVYVIKKDKLEKSILSNPAIAKDFIVWFNMHFRKTQTKFRDLVLYGKKGAVYSTIIRMTNSYGKMQRDGSILIDLPLTNQELANFCGGTRESVNRLLSELKKQNVISVTSGYITVHKLDFLKNEIMCEGCPKEICCID